jgi:sugar/nucleoside kinase (ribokinase family)
LSSPNTKKAARSFRSQPDGSRRRNQNTAARRRTNVDPTGAGDTFTTAFLLHLQETGDPLQAARFGNITASISVEYPGVTGIPTRDEVLSHMDEYPFDPGSPMRSQYEANLPA